MAHPQRMVERHFARGRPHSMAARRFTAVVRMAAERIISRWVARMAAAQWAGVSTAGVRHISQWVARMAAGPMAAERLTAAARMAAGRAVTTADGSAAENHSLPQP